MNGSADPMTAWIDIRDGGRLLYVPDFYQATEPDELFNWLRTELPWRQESVRGKPVPRLNAWFADADLRYSYSGLSHVGSGWLPELEKIKQKVEVASGAPFNSVLLNRYRDGRHSIGFHADDEPELGRNPVVSTLSLGAERRLVLRHRSTKEVLRYDLGHGSLLVMAGTSQHHWLHGVPKTESPVGERISLTFRWIADGSKPGD
jgi:alkylated DNA repair dioxygenase AlkB